MTPRIVLRSPRIAAISATRLRSRDFNPHSSRRLLKSNSSRSHGRACFLGEQIGNITMCNGRVANANGRVMKSRGTPWHFCCFLRRSFCWHGSVHAWHFKNSFACPGSSIALSTGRKVKSGCARVVPRLQRQQQGQTQVDLRAPQNVRAYAGMCLADFAISNKTEENHQTKDEENHQTKDCCPDRPCSRPGIIWGPSRGGSGGCGRTVGWLAVHLPGGSHGFGGNRGSH